MVFILRSLCLYMKLPYIIAVDDDEHVLNSVKRDLRRGFGDQYRVLSTTSGQEALQALQELKKKQEQVALLVADQRMPEMQGVEFLAKALELYPDAKKVLLTAYSDTEAAIKAINELQLDYYFVKPWDPPEEKLFPVLEGLLKDWQAVHHPDHQGIKVVGYQFSPKSHTIKNFLANNLVPYRWLDVQTNKSAVKLQNSYECSDAQLPLIVLEDGKALCNPDIRELARKIGHQTEASKTLYDVVIIGAGPAGLAAAVYGGSEGIKTLLVEKLAAGGQAGTSSRIDNYLGFPNGLSGAELTRRAMAQVKRFGVEMLSPQEVKNIELQGGYKILTLADDSRIKTRSLIIATGVHYRTLEVKGIHDYTGAGVYYGGAITEAPFCRKKNIFVLGGGNSAGQAAVYLSQYAQEVIMIVREASLQETMSQYLIEQIENTANVKVWNNTQVAEAQGEGKLERLQLVNTKEDRRWTEEGVGALFVYIGAEPRTQWLPLQIITNEEGYIETGRDLKRYEDYKEFWNADRDPYLLESCTPGIFAAGDVRAGAMNRVASAVGEGAMAIKFVHQYLAES